MLRYLNFEPSFKLRWCRTRDSFESQIPVTNSCRKVANSGTRNQPKLLGFMAWWVSNYFICKRFEVQTLLWPLEFVIQMNLE